MWYHVDMMHGSRGCVDHLRVPRGAADNRKFTKYILNHSALILCPCGDKAADGSGVTFNGAKRDCVVLAGSSLVSSEGTNADADASTLAATGMFPWLALYSVAKVFTN